MSEFPPSSLRPLIEEVFELLKSRNETISVAETVYTLESRLAYAGWTPAHLEGYNGPTPTIVAGLADHVRQTLGSTYTVSESGTAGPTGGTTRNRTPGYVAVAVSTAHGTYTREVETGSSDREKNMVAFTGEGLKLVRDVILGKAVL
ncbi:predicted protein [Aspergillus terreus NIH2624]|uniref:CinA C-terminal domain-containing protein n=1 Tax=Aspergillus terreus (strain NIH 2624 / FGSC A1156) TaxID=341663 RepID=Q0C9K5_ASPTN|nr:uncharacterized protein ATEG_09629 [Aspergillus terreus NIH2624]EAU29820.1 predicted protein [Aspergillus terreus NIH2624]